MQGFEFGDLDAELRADGRGNQLRSSPQITTALGEFDIEAPFVVAAASSSDESRAREAFDKRDSVAVSNCSRLPISLTESGEWPQSASMTRYCGGVRPIK